jgi:hypothetical protein
MEKILRATNKSQQFSLLSLISSAGYGRIDASACTKATISKDTVIDAVSSVPTSQS